MRYRITSYNVCYTKLLRLGNNSALEINLGKTNFNRDKKYFEDNFYNWYKDKYKYTSYSYQGYDATTPIALQVHYLIHKSINLDGAKGFYWYYGFGGMISHQKYTYYYTYFDNSRWYSNIQEEVTNIDFGADATIGLEYFLENTPISFFLDATLFIEIYDDFFATDVNGGIGARYNF